MKKRKELFKFPYFWSRSEDYVNSKKFSKLFEVFSGKYVNNNLGIIVETKVSADGQTLILYDETLRAALIPNLLLRKYAVDGDR